MENGSFEIDIRVYGFIDISAYQFTIQWNKEQLRFVEVMTSEIFPQFGNSHTENGLLTTLWDDPNGESTSLAEASSLMKMRFEKISAANPDHISIAGSITPIKMYDQNLQEVSLSFRESEGEKIESGFFYPNPFSTKTKISFSASESQTAILEVIDVVGKKLDAQEIHVSKGWNEITYNGAGLTEGMYVFKLQLKEKQVKAKIIKRNE
jgi:hypothetical protein